MVAMSAGIRSIKSVENRKDNKMSEHIAEFLKNDEAKVEEMIKKYPITIPITEVATLLGMSPKTVRAAIESGNLGVSRGEPPEQLTKGLKSQHHHLSVGICKYAIDRQKRRVRSTLQAKERL